MDGALGDSWEAFAVLENPGGFPSMRVGKDSTGVWLPAGTKGRVQDLCPGVGRVTERGILLSELLMFFTAQPLPVLPCRLSG